MPWRRYKPTKGKYGPIYQIDRGVNVRQDQRGLWTIFLTKDGERRNRTIGPGREGLTKAIKVAEKIVSQFNTINFTEKDTEEKTSSPFFSDYSQDWLERNAKRWAYRTYERYEEILRLHIWPDKTFSKKKLDEIVKRDIRRFLSLVYKKRSAATVELVHSILSGIFEEAMEDDLVTSNPASKLLRRILPPEKQRDEKDPEPFTVEERNRFLEHAGKILSWDLLLVLKIMAFAGLRLGEVLALRLRNFNAKTEIYHVQESFYRKKFSHPKKGKKRLVDLPSFLVKELNNYIHSLKKERLKSGHGMTVDLLFLDPDEKYQYPYSQRKIQETVKKVCGQAELKRRKPHDLRHTYATIMLMAHQSPAYVQKQLGHSSISMTVDIYGHWIPGAGRKELEDALQPPVPNSGENCIFLHMQKQKGL